MSAERVFVDPSNAEKMLTDVYAELDTKIAKDKIGDGLSLDENGVLSVKVDGTSITVDENGVISANTGDSSGRDEIFAFLLDTSESNPASCITYIEGNSNYIPVQVDPTTGEMNYGDWGSAWFIQNLKVVMLKFDGTVAYELNRNDYSKKTDGTDSDIANEAFNGNAMIGIPTVWVKIETVNPTKHRFYFANKQVDEGYHAYAHTDANGNIMPYTYMPIYNGWVDSSNRLRSLSGKTPTAYQSGEVQIDEARANNLSGQNIWDLEVLCDRQLINLLLMLIGKSTDTQEIFGDGNVGSKGIQSTGAMDVKGLFYGQESRGKLPGVKIFGMEHYWGNLWRRMHGLVSDNGTIKIKMTKGTQDGSMATDYNTTGEGYITVGTVPPASGLISEMHINQYGLFPSAADGSSTTYYCDNVEATTSGRRGIGFALVGGDDTSSGEAGAFACNWIYPASQDGADLGATPSCKPLV